MSCYCGQSDCPKCHYQGVQDYSDEARQKWEKISGIPPRKEEENLKSDGQRESEPNPKKAAVTITYSDLTLKIEDDISGLASTLIKKLFA